MSTSNQEASAGPARVLGSLEEAPFLAGASERSKEQLLAATQLKKFSPGEIVVRKGDMPTEAIVIKSGSLRIFVDEPTGRRDIRTMKPGQILGELGVLGGHRRTASAEALEESEVWLVERDAFADVYSDDPQVSIEIAKVMAPYILEDDELAMDALALDLSSRVVKRLQELDADDIPGISLQHLATLSGGPQSDVVRILETLQQKGILEVTGDGITVLDPAALASI